MKKTCRSGRVDISALLLIAFLLQLFMPILVFADDQAEGVSYEGMPYQDMNALFAQKLEDEGVVKQLRNGDYMYSHYFPKIYPKLIEKYLMCYSGKSYFGNDNRAYDFFETTVIPGDVTLLEERYVISIGFRQHEAMVKSYFLFDLQEKEALIGMLNYAKSDLEPFVDVYHSPTASSELVGKGMEIILEEIRDYMTATKEYHAHENFPPFTFYTSRCLY